MKPGDPIYVYFGTAAEGRRYRRENGLTRRQVIMATCPGQLSNGERRQLRPVWTSAEWPLLADMLARVEQTTRRIPIINSANGHDTPPAITHKAGDPE